MGDREVRAIAVCATQHIGEIDDSGICSTHDLIIDAARTQLPSCLLLKGVVAEEDVEKTARSYAGVEQIRTNV